MRDRLSRLADKVAPPKSVTYLGLNKKGELLIIRCKIKSDEYGKTLESCQDNYGREKRVEDMLNADEIKREFELDDITTREIHRDWSRVERAVKIGSKTASAFGLFPPAIDRIIDITGEIL